MNRDMLRCTNFSVSALVAGHALLVGLEVGGGWVLRAMQGVDLRG